MLGIRRGSVASCRETHFDTFPTPSSGKERITAIPGNCLARPAVVVRSQVFHLALVARPIRFVPEGERGTNVLEFATAESVTTLLRLDVVDTGSVQPENLRLP